MAWIFLVWYLSYLWVVIHVFTQKSQRLAKTDAIFVKPHYDALLLDQSILLNRRRYWLRLIFLYKSSRQTSSIRSMPAELLYEEHYPEHANPDDSYSDLSVAPLSTLEARSSKVDTVTKIYICATMWHENSHEMLQMLMSIFRMDEDQSARKNAQKFASA